MASVKHLNPRQGITIADRWNELADEAERRRVKHLNPRQGITTAPRGGRASRLAEGGV